MIVTTPRLGESISGAILYDETIRQQTLAGVPFAQTLEAADIVPGIKVDAGAKALAAHPDELVTEGLDGLRERLAEYASTGARFAKWRAVITIAQASRAAAAPRRTLFRWRDTRGSAKRLGSCRSSSQRSSWTAITTSRAVPTLRPRPCRRCSAR